MVTSTGAAWRHAVTRRLGLPELAGRRPIVLAIVFDTLGVGLLFPISLFYFTVTTDLPVVLIGALVSAAAFLSLPVGLAGGELVQRFGAKRVMVANNLCSALGYLGYCFAHDSATVFVGAFLVAVADRLFWSCWPPFLRTIAGAGSVDTWFAFVEAVKGACMAAGAGLTALFLATEGSTGIRLLVLANVATCLISAVLIGTRSMPRPGPDPGHQPPTRPAAGWSATVRDRRHVLLAVGQLLITPVGLLSMTAFPVLFVRNWHLGAWIGPLLFTVGCLLNFTLQTPVTALLRGVPRGRLVLVGALLSCVAMAALTVFSVLPTPGRGTATGVATAVMVIIGIAGVIYLPSSNSVLMSVVTEQNVGRVSALFHTGTSIALCGTPALTAALLGHPAVLWIVLAVMSAAGCACFLAVTGVRSDLRQ